MYTKYLFYKKKYLKNILSFLYFLYTNLYSVPFLITQCTVTGIDKKNYFLREKILVRIN